jgi:tetratricopeptide (TPR) repeat protein
MKRILLLISISISAGMFGQTENLTLEQASSVFMEQGREKSSKGDWTAAINDYNNAISKDAKNAEAYYHRGIARNNLKDYRGAITDYSKAIYINSDDNIVAASYLERGKCYYLIGNKSNACMDFNKASGLGNQEGTNAVQNYCN